MSDTIDFSLLSSLLNGVDRELRLVRLQVDAIVPRLAALDSRVAAMEQSFHDLVAEVARGFGQVQQQMTRQEKRTDAVDEGLATLRTELAGSTARIIEAIGART
jgi:hypothetical protein